MGPRGFSLGAGASDAIEEWNSNCIDTTNTVSGRPVYYFADKNYFEAPQDAGQLILANCSNVVIQNLDCSETYIGIIVAFSRDVSIFNTSCLNCSYTGILFDHTNRSFIRDSNCSFSQEDHYSGGINLKDSYHNQIRGCEVWGSTGSGIHLLGSDLNTLENNSFSGNAVDGVCLVSSSGNLIQNNTITGNKQGIFLYTYAKSWPSSGENIATRNQICGNSKNGIEVFASSPAHIKATGNWWGHPSGPYHPTENPKGKGDNVTDYVEFEEWLRSDDLSVVKAPEESTIPHSGRVTLVFLLVFTLSSLLLVVYEPLRFALLHHLAPLYTRLNPDKIENDIKQQKIRGCIYQYIEDNPGINFSSVRKEVKVGTGTAVYHLGVLLRERYLRSSVSGNRKLFWTKRDFPGVEDSALTDIHRNILETLEKSGTLSRAEIREKTGISKSTVGFNIKQLVEMGKVEEETRGKKNYCSLKLY